MWNRIETRMCFPQFYTVFTVLAMHILFKRCINVLFSQFFFKKLLFWDSTLPFFRICKANIYGYFSGFFKTLLYVVFVIIMIKIHTFPLFAIRPMYLTLRYVS